MKRLLFLFFAFLPIMAFSTNIELVDEDYQISYYEIDSIEYDIILQFPEYANRYKTKDIIEKEIWDKIITNDMQVKMIYTKFVNFCVICYVDCNKNIINNFKSDDKLKMSLLKYLEERISNNDMILPIDGGYFVFNVYGYFIYSIEN